MNVKADALCESSLEPKDCQMLLAEAIFKLVVKNPDWKLPNEFDLIFSPFDRTLLDETDQVKIYYIAFEDHLFSLIPCSEVACNWVAENGLAYH